MTSSSRRGALDLEELPAKYDDRLLYLAALVVGLLIVCLIDRDRFWGADLRRRSSRRRPRHS